MAPKNVAGICWNAARGTPLGQTFLQTLGAFGQAPIALAKKGDDYDIGRHYAREHASNGRHEAGLGIANYLTGLMDYSPPGILDMAWDERTRVFAQGGCAMTYVWSGNARPGTAIPTRPRTARWLTCRIRHGNGAKNRSTLGGWSLGIPTNLEQDRRRSPGK